MSTWVLRTIALLVAGWALTPAFALEAGCLRLFDDLTKIQTDIPRVLDETAGWKKIHDHLIAEVTPHSRQPFVIHGNRTGDSFNIAPVPEDIRSAIRSISKIPVERIPDGGRVVRSPRFGYDLDTGFREIGPLNYIVLDARGSVREIGAPTGAALDEFLRHVNGVELTGKELERISELNRRILADLRKNPAAKSKLDSFAKSRGWPVGLAEEGGLAYFDPNVLDVRAWAKKNGFSIAELIDAGWLRQIFDHRGSPRFVVNSPDAIKIPYLAESGKDGVPVWRSRNLAKDNPKLPKYTGWQIDRSVNRTFSTHERLYNGWKLPKVKGRPVVITEGEFKCLVAERITGIPMFGIPGISEFDDEMAKAFVAAEASEYFVILDRDPHAKALFRADEVTDSNRAAYAIARQLETAGAKNVYVGILPEMVDGEKLGIDDLVLKYGTEPVTKVLAEARKTTADVYAKKIGLDPKFQELMKRRSRLRKAIEQNKLHRRRFGIAEGDPQIASAGALLRKLNRTYSSYLENELNGARAIDDASGKVNSIRSGTIPGRSSKKIVFEKGDYVEADVFSEDVILLDYVTAGASPSDCRPIGCGQVPFSRRELEAAFAGETPSGTLLSALKTAETIAAETGFQPKNFEEFSVFALAGRLSHVFPLDEYRFDFGALLHSDDLGASSVLPLTIFKRVSGRAVAISELHVPTRPDYWKNRLAKLKRTVEFLRGHDAIRRW